MHLLVTGGAGFIGCNFVRHVLREREEARVRVLDKLTYAGSRENLEDVLGDPRLELVEGDICDQQTVDAAVGGVDAVVHLAAESHVDRSIISAEAAVRTNFVGSFRLFEAARATGVDRLLHVSTDEVYGACLGEPFAENAPLQPRNPYAATKAGADRLAHSYFVTYDLPVVIARPSNNYGPYQYPEKLIPFFTWRALNDEHLPVYGDGMQVRDWLHVQDHCRALLLLLERGAPGEAYNIHGGDERPNMETIRLILDELDKPEGLIRHVEDRPGHDVRYAMDASKIRALGWEPRIGWERGIRRTVRWFAEHRDWMERAVARGREYFEEWYAGR
ncbi:MAG: dTDP-glucose 4,6-dehydratase [Armatimonadota bacterium]|nr:dTDP-glucose 4,6-dehydratase [Armatimonadota bacterium]